MRIPTTKRQHGLRFNITPLIDVIFLLIIFFLAASHFVKSEATEPVALPEAAQTADEQSSPHRLVLTVLADGSLSVAGNPVDLQQVERMILIGRAEDERFELRIRSDRTVLYSEIEPLLLACAKAGVTNVAFAVVQK